MSVEEGEDVARDLIRFVFSFMLDDLTWQLVGFRRRPRRDAWLDRFNSEKKLKLENALKREFCCLGLATSARWIHSRSSDIESPRLLLARILEISIYGNLDGSPPPTPNHICGPIFSSKTATKQSTSFSVVSRNTSIRNIPQSFIIA